MSPLRWLLTAVLILTLGVGINAPLFAKPNVLIIVLDDQNTWVEPIGEYPDVHTPSLTRLAEQGVTFTQAHCQAPICAPSRVSFLSGLRPSTTGLYSLGSQLHNHPAFGTGKHKTLHQTFKESGYTTATVGKVFHSDADLNAIASWLDHRGQGTDYGPQRGTKFTPAGLTGSLWLIDWGAHPVTEEQMPDYLSVTWATNRLAQFATQPATPFFMTVGLVRPHVPLYVPQKYFDLYPADSFALPFYEADDLTDTPRFARYLHWKLPEPRTEPLISYHEWTNHTHAYLACVSFVDAMIGRLLEGLASNNLVSNTVVAVISDHGYHLGEKGLTAKTTLWDRATRVPLLMAGPGIATNGVCPQPVDLLDLYPTLLDLCELPAYAPLEGLSLRPQLQNPAHPPPRRPALTTHGPNNHSVVDGRYRYIRYADGTEEFYDRYVDPNERNNRIAHPNFREQARRLAAHLPGTNAPNISGTSRIALIGADDIVRWEGNPIYDPQDPDYAGGRLDGAGWIWWRNVANADGGETSFFRLRFPVSDPLALSTATLTATADNVLEVWVNGVPLFTNAAWRELTLTNIAALLQPGTNVLAAKASNNPGTASPAGFLASLEISDASGVLDYLVTAPTGWRSAPSASGEAWTTVGFDDSAWGNPVVMAPYDTGPWAGQTQGGTPVKREVLATPVTEEAAVDEDADLLPDWWERHYTGGTNVLSGLDSNHDADCAPDALEYRMGSHPLDPFSCLRLRVSREPESVYRLSVRGEPGRDYRLHSTADLLRWSVASVWSYGSGEELGWPLPVTAPAYYRVEAHPDARTSVPP